MLELRAEPSYYPYHTKRKCPGKHVKGVAGQPFDKEIMGEAYVLSHLSRSQEQRLYQQSHSQFEIKGTEKAGQREGKWWDFFLEAHSSRPYNYSAANMCYFFFF